MSFGWSAGDVISAIGLVTKIITSVRNIGRAREHFQELESELQGLQRALHEISGLAGAPGQVPEIVALKFAACLCEDTLKRFYEKIKPFDNSLGVASHTSRLKAAPRMVRWELLVKKDIPEFRSYLVAHVGSLNLRLLVFHVMPHLITTTANKKSCINLSAKSYTSVQANRIQHDQATKDIRERVGKQTMVICEKISLILRSNYAPGLDTLLSLVTNVWDAQKSMMDMLAKAANELPPPDLQHTWIQAPVQFEDALGRMIPIPSEYDWDKVEAIIQAQFKRGPGHAKVRSGEYELFSKGRSIAPLKASNSCLFPGMRITMTFIIGQYIGSERCPRLGCDSRNFVGQSQGAQLCGQCHSWFLKSESSPPRPLRRQFVGYDTVDPLKHQACDASVATEANMVALLDDRRSFKNMSVYITELPATPTRFRDKYHRGYGGQHIIATSPQKAPERCITQANVRHPRSERTWFKMNYQNRRFDGSFVGNLSIAFQSPELLESETNKDYYCEVVHAKQSITHKLARGVKFYHPQCLQVSTTFTINDSRQTSHGILKIAVYSDASKYRFSFVGSAEVDIWEDPPEGAKYSRRCNLVRKGVYQGVIRIHLTYGNIIPEPPALHDKLDTPSAYKCGPMFSPLHLNTSEAPKPSTLYLREYQNSLADASYQFAVNYPESLRHYTPQGDPAVSSIPFRGQSCQQRYIPSPPVSARSQSTIVRTATVKRSPTLKKQKRDMGEENSPNQPSY